MEPNRVLVDSGSGLSPRRTSDLSRCQAPNPDDHTDKCTHHKCGHPRAEKALQDWLAKSPGGPDFLPDGGERCPQEHRKAPSNDSAYENETPLSASARLHALMNFAGGVGRVSRSRSNGFSASFEGFPEKRSFVLLGRAHILSNSNQLAGIIACRLSCFGQFPQTKMRPSSSLHAGFFQVVDERAAKSEIVPADLREVGWKRRKWIRSCNAAPRRTIESIVAGRSH